MRNTNLLVLLGAAVLVAACQTKPTLPVAEPQPVVPATPEAPLATHLFTLQDGQDVIGEIQVVHTTKEDTLSDIARRFNLGYEELVRANPSVDPWIPGEGTEVVLPTQFVLPDAPHEGIVVNLAALRMFYFPKRAPGEPQQVISHPIGIGKVGWVTPEGETKVTSKRKNPTWTPPASVRKEHAEKGDPLPKVVPAGPDNPLGAFAMNLGWPGYLMHGTNKPYGVDMRASHGCMRFYPEDIALLFDEIAVGTKVRVVNQRLTSGWREGQLYVQVMPPSEEELELEKTENQPVPMALTDAVLADLMQQAQNHQAILNTSLLKTLAAVHTGVSTPVLGEQTEAQYLAQARRVENRLPDGATWDGNKELRVTAEEFEAMRDGTILPQESTQPATTTPAISSKSDSNVKKKTG